MLESCLRCSSCFSRSFVTTAAPVVWPVVVAMVLVAFVATSMVLAAFAVLGDGA